MRLRLLAVSVVAAASPAGAAPAADAVVAWSSSPLGPVGDAINDVATRAGASYVDASPAAIPLPDARPLIRRGIASYTALEFDAAQTALDAAAEIIDQTGAAFVDPTMLGDLYVHRAMTYTQRGEDTRAWDDLVVAAALDPTRTLDPAGIAPRIVERFSQARAQVSASPRAKVRLVGPAGCTVRVDGASIIATELDLVFGKHWLEATCPGRVAVHQRLSIDRAAIDVSIAGAEIRPPDDGALLIQARGAAARAFVAVTLVGRTAVVRRLAVTGKEQDRITVALGGGRDAREVAAAVNRLLQPLPVAAPTPWYRSRWVWGLAGAAIAGGVLVPFALRSGTETPGSVTIRPDYDEPDWGRRP
jgi:hypothetical protein